MYMCDLLAFIQLTPRTRRMTFSNQIHGNQQLKVQKGDQTPLLQQ